MLKKNLDKIAAARLDKPLATQEDIAKETGLSQSTVDRGDKILGKAGLREKFPEVEKFIAGSMRLMQAAQNELEERITDPEEKKKVSARDLNTITDSAQKRYSLFKGDATDEEGGIKAIESINYIIPKENEV